VPDNEDYQWLGWLVSHPDEWTDDDLSTARSLIVDQRRAIEESQPLDAKTLRSMQEVVDQLEAAVRAHLAG
jgi:hypothetical protein